MVTTTLGMSTVIFCHIDYQYRKFGLCKQRKLAVAQKKRKAISLVLQITVTAAYLFVLFVTDVVSGVLARMGHAVFVNANRRRETTAGPS